MTSGAEPCRILAGRVGEPRRTSAWARLSREWTASVTEPGRGVAPQPCRTSWPQERPVWKVTNLHDGDRQWSAIILMSPCSRSRQGDNDRKPTEVTDVRFNRTNVQKQHGSEHITVRRISKRRESLANSTVSSWRVRITGTKVTGRSVRWDGREGGDGKDAINGGRWGPETDRTTHEYRCDGSIFDKC